jgi:hypothetical protein
MIAVKKSQRTPEECNTVFAKIMFAFVNLNAVERLVSVTNELLFNLAEIYPDSSSELKSKIEEQYKEICLMTSYEKPTVVAKPLSIMIAAYHTVTRCARHTPLYNIAQNLISETAITLEDWYEVANNEIPSPSLKKELIAEIIPGPLKNMALQMILVQGKTVGDMGYIKRNSRHGSALYVAANNASVKMLSASN